MNTRDGVWRQLVAAFSLSFTLTAWSGTSPDQIDPWLGAADGDGIANTTAYAAPEQRHEALLDRALGQGSIPVIVRFKTQGTPLAGQGTRLTQAERTRLSARQQGVLNQLGLSNERDRSGAKIKRFSRVQGLALHVDVIDLMDLLDNPEVEDVFEDVAYPPALIDTLPLLGASSDGTFQSGGTSYSGQDQVVAILDTGVDKNHPFLAGKVVSEACYSSNLCPGGLTASTATNSGLNCNPAIAGCGHGTHVAGIAAGKGSSFSGVAQNAGVIAIQVFSSTSCGGSPCVRAYTSDIIRGLERVYDLLGTYSVAAANLSLGGGSFTSHCDSDPIKTIIDALSAAGTATVIASGNDGYTNAISSPGCVSSAITVGSTTKTDSVSSFSNSAPLLDLLAPGSAINSSVVGGGFASWNGTSMAAPHVAGAWAVMKSVKPTASVAEILTALQEQGAMVTDSRNGLSMARIQIDDAIAVLSGDGVDVPSAPIATPATAVYNTGFTANWGRVTGATGYRLDVSTSDTFSSYVSGYDGLDTGKQNSLAITGLSASTTYFYRVSAYNTAGTGLVSNVITVTTASVPTAPTFPIANAPTQVTSNEVTADWSSVPGATGYRLDVSTSNTFRSYVSGYKNRDVGSQTGLLITRLSPGKTYFYRLRAYNSVGVSANSNTVTVTTRIAAPSLSAAAKVTSDGFTAKWGSVKDATGYRLDIATDAAFTSFVDGYQDRDMGNLKILAVTGLSASTTYYCRVRAYNANGVSADSKPRSVTTRVAIPEAPTANEAVNITPTSFLASWNLVVGATGYRLDVSTTDSFSTYVSGYKNLSLRVTGRNVTRLIPNTTYYYRVRAFNSSGTSADSPVQMLVTAP